MLLCEVPPALSEIVVVKTITTLNQLLCPPQLIKASLVILPLLGIT